MGQVSIRKYLEDLGATVVEVGDNWNIDCVFCDDTRKRLGFKKSTGQFNCFNCEERGSFKKFQNKVKDNRQLEIKFDENGPEKKAFAEIDQTLADKYHGLLDRKNREALNYLMSERGFSRDTINHFQLGSWKTKGHEYVSIPFFEHGKITNIKFRAVHVKDKKFKWRRIKNGKSSLFHDEVCDQEHSEVFFCEAELDAIALYNAGFKNVIACTTGAKKFQSYWFDRLEKFKRIYLVFDNDVDGQDGAEKMADRLGFDRCLNVKLPDVFKDVNEYFWNDAKKQPRHTAEDFKKLVKNAHKFSVRGAITLRESLRQIKKERYLNDEEEMYGLSTPWNCVNKLIGGGAKLGQLVVVSAPPKRGKTRFAMNWQRHLVNTCDTPAGLYCCEMTHKELSKIYVAMSCKDFTSPEEISDIQIDETALLHNDSDKAFFVSPDHDELTLDAVCDWAKRLKHRYGMKWFCFDNLHFLVRGDNIKDRIGEVTRRLKLLATTENIVVVLIVHPRKVGDKMMTADDLKDSSSTYQDLDTLVILHRDRKETDNDDDETGGLDEMVQVHVEGRSVPGGQTRLYYQGERGLFFESGNLHERAVKKWKARIQQRKERKRRRR